MELPKSVTGKEINMNSPHVREAGKLMDQIFTLIQGAADDMSTRMSGKEVNDVVMTAVYNLIPNFCLQVEKSTRGEINSEHLMRWMAEKYMEVLNNGGIKTSKNVFTAPSNFN